MSILKTSNNIWVPNIKYILDNGNISRKVLEEFEGTYIHN